MVPLICAWDYFPNHKGKVSGLLMSAFGISSFFLNMITTAIVNPNDEKALIHINKDLDYFGEDVANRVPKMLKYLTFLFIFCVILTIILISRPKQGSPKT